MLFGIHRRRDIRNGLTPAATARHGAAANRYRGNLMVVNCCPMLGSKTHVIRTRSERWIIHAIQIGNFACAKDMKIQTAPSTMQKPKKILVLKTRRQSLKISSGSETPAIEDAQPVINPSIAKSSINNVARRAASKIAR
jgi:hypothetical protein